MESKDEMKGSDYFELPESFNSFCDELLFHLSQEAVKYFKLKGPAAVKYRETYYLKFYQILIRCSLDKCLDEKSDLNVVKRVMETLCIMYHVFDRFSEFDIDVKMNKVMDKAINDSRRTYNRVRRYHDALEMERATFEGREPKLWPPWLSLLRPLEKKWSQIRKKYDKGYAKSIEPRKMDERKIIYPFSHRQKYKPKKIRKRKIAGTHIQYFQPIQETKNELVLKF